jgi:antitoxin component YwqK of YwqJK toxin-antitoxin module
VKGGEQMEEKEINGLDIGRGIKVDYKGQVNEGKPNGWGKAYFQNGSMYDGEWKDGKQHGLAKEHYPDGTLQYDGYYKDGKRDGQGKAYLNDGKLKYEGKWEKGEKVDGPSTHSNWA